MTNKYRKYLEPEYGVVSPEVSLDAPQNMDFNHPAEWRTACHLETIADLVGLWRSCNCYDKLVSLKTENIIISEHIPVRIYYPQKETNSKVLMFIHGGGFMMNNPDVYDQVNRYLAYYGEMIVVSPDYRLCPEHKFPAGLDDVYATAEWIEKNVPDKELYIGGDSAGGNLTAAATIMARDKKGPKVNGQILIYPLTSFCIMADMESEKRYGKGHFLEYNSKEQFLNNIYFTNKSDAYSPYASPLEADNLSDLPKACFISAECDPLLDQGLMYAARLEDEGVKVEYHIYKGMIHAFINRPHHQTIEALNQMINFIHE